MDNDDFIFVGTLIGSDDVFLKVFSGTLQEAVTAVTVWGSELEDMYGPIFVACYREAQMNSICAHYKSLKG